VTLPERLRAAASAERLSDWVRVSRTGCIYLREDEAGAQPFLFQVERRRYREDGRWVPRWHYGQNGRWEFDPRPTRAASYTHLRAHETVLELVCRLLLDKKIM